MSVEAGVLIPGGKTGVLLLHDLGAPAAELRPLAQHFNEEGFTVCLPQIGAAAADDISRVTASKLIGDAEAALARVRERCTDVLIVGVSYGAMLGLDLARQNKTTVQAVVMVEPRAWLSGVNLPFVQGVSRFVSQARLAGLSGKLAGLLASRPASTGAPSAQMMGLAASSPVTDTSTRMLYGTGQLLDCLHATWSDVRQPILIARRNDAPSQVIETSILLQRRLGGRVETAILDGDSSAKTRSLPLQADLAERGSRFLGTIMTEVTTRRDNELRRQRMSAGRSNAA